MEVPSRAPQILQIYRDRLKPRRRTAYDRIEREIASDCAEFGFPHAYLAIEPLTGPREVWFLNGWESEAEQKQVADEYLKNAALVEALERHAKRKSSLDLEPVNEFAYYRPELSRGDPWSMGVGRFLVITVTKARRRFNGTVFETPDHNRLALLAVTTRKEAGAHAAAAGHEARIFAVRPYWSNPAAHWVAADPGFWRTDGSTKNK
jgi:hypothetical protein